MPVWARWWVRLWDMIATYGVARRSGRLTANRLLFTGMCPVSPIMALAQAVFIGLAMVALEATTAEAQQRTVFSWVGLREA